MRTYAHRPTPPESVVNCVTREHDTDFNVPRDLAIKMKRRMGRYSLFDLRADMETTMRFIAGKNKGEAEVLVVKLQQIVRGHR